jgi:phenylacetate-CoA ligase
VIAVRAFPRSLERLRRAGSRAVLHGLLDKAAVLYDVAEWWSPEVLRARQAGWLREAVVAAAESSPFYRRRLRDAGWSPEDPHGFDRVPPLTREDLVQHGDEIAAPGRRGLSRSSGGSGSAPVAVQVDRDAYAWYIAGMWRGFRWWGVDPSDPICLVSGRSSGTLRHALISWAKDRVLNWRRVPVDDRFDDDAPRALGAIARTAPAVLYGYPSAVHRLARVPGGRQARLGIRVIVLTGEPLYTVQRDQILDAFQCPVAQEYGSGELGSVAFECPHGTLHVSAESVLLESLPSADGSASPRLLATHLRNRRFPLVRYENGDVGVLLADACACGRGLPALRVQGRARDRLVWEGGAEAARPRIDHFLRLLPAHLSGSVQVTQPTDESVVVRVARGGTAPRDLGYVLSAGTEAFAEWRVQVEAVDRLHRLPSGKLPYFVGRTP